MFTEPVLSAHKNVGWIEVITGCMFSGKTEELIRRITRAKIAKQQVLIFKPTLDNRYHSQHIVSHDANAIYSIPVEKAQDIWDKATSEPVDVVGIDEGQFFDNDIIDVCNELANSGTRVIVAGLDMDYQGKPFGPMPYLMAVAEFVTKLHAICAVSGELANFSYRKVPSDSQVLLGETDSYEARSRRYFYGLAKE
ncbi:MAG: thymidine kinase [Microscillaceae bacterium]|nr:thymidine kinase [Microscillaceae bacterium]